MTVLINVSTSRLSHCFGKVALPGLKNGIRQSNTAMKSYNHKKGRPHILWLPEKKNRTARGVSRTAGRICFVLSQSLPIKRAWLAWNLLLAKLVSNSETQGKIT